jgi:hypothetical protein
MAVWAVTIPLFVVVASIALRPPQTTGAVGSSRKSLIGAARVLHTWRWSLVALWFTALILLILVRFWTYWSTLI